MKIEPNENAFPCVSEGATIFEWGLTKREYFAALAMQGYITGVRASGDGINIKELCTSAIWTADVLIKELNKDQ